MIIIIKKEEGLELVHTNLTNQLILKMEMSRNKGYNNNNQNKRSRLRIIKTSPITSTCLFLNNYLKSKETIFKMLEILKSKTNIFKG